MNRIATAFLLLGFLACAESMHYAASFSFLLFASVLYVPLITLLVALGRRAIYGQVSTRMWRWACVLIGTWLFGTSACAVSMVRRPGHEDSGMFGVLLLIWPAIVSAIGCGIVALFFGGTQTTYGREREDKSMPENCVSNPHARIWNLTHKWHGQRRKNRIVVVALLCGLVVPFFYIGFLAEHLPDWLDMVIVGAIVWICFAEIMPANIDGVLRRLQHPNADAEPDRSSPASETASSLGSRLDREGRSELHYAARDGDLAAVQRLVKEGANVNLADRRGWTPLHFAAQAVSSPVAEFLIAHGAAVDARDAHGNTPAFDGDFQFPW